MERSFPPTFTWGVATASYQIEGAANEDGRGPSIWDTFSATPGKVVAGDTGLVACDHYHRFHEDIRIMQELGVQSYRFSIAWPRLFPAGDDIREQRGFDFYNRLIDALCEAGITPLVTLYHWDLPQPLQDQGGWANRQTAYRFAEYSKAAVEAFGDRVKNWVTLNEPWCVAWLGYMSGVHAPGVQNLEHAIAASHHTALAHGLATRAIRAVDPDARVGLAVNMTNYRLDDPDNAELQELSHLLDGHINRWWIDAFSAGRYPQQLVDLYGNQLRRVQLAGDEDILNVPTDFLGINYYSDSFIGTPLPTDRPVSEGGLFPFPQRASMRAPHPHTAMGWPITPSGIRDLLVRVHSDWPEIKAIFITENGAAFEDSLEADGSVNDVERSEFIAAHIEAVGEAIDAGVPVHGYYAWSLLDNFEWAEGYAKRFGLVYVDFETQQRILKRSALLYRSLVLAHAPVGVLAHK